MSELTTTSVNLLDVEIALCAPEVFERMSDDDLRDVVIALKDELEKRGWALHCTRAMES